MTYNAFLIPTFQSMKKRKEDAQLISLTSLTGDHHHGQSCIVTVAVPLEFRSWAYADRCYVVCRSACEFGSLGCAVQNAQIDFLHWTTFMTNICHNLCINLFFVWNGVHVRVCLVFSLLCRHTLKEWVVSFASHWSATALSKPAVAHCSNKKEIEISRQPVT